MKAKGETVVGARVGEGDTERKKKVQRESPKKGLVYLKKIEEKNHLEVGKEEKKKRKSK